MLDEVQWVLNERLNRSEWYNGGVECDLDEREDEWIKLCWMLRTEPRGALWFALAGACSTQPDRARCPAGDAKRENALDKWHALIGWPDFYLI
jgi:hypothetical protein